MMDKIAKLIKGPGKYLPLFPKILLQHLCFLFRGSSFFMQGQMDINPRSRWYNPEFVRMTGGYGLTGEKNGKREIVDMEPWDTTRRDMLVLLIRTVLQNRVEGDFAELGVYRGSSAKVIHYYAPEKRLYLFDTFEGFHRTDVLAEKRQTGMSVSDHHGFTGTSLEQVSQYIKPKNGNVLFYPGYFPKSIPEGFERYRFAFVHLDVDLYEPTYKGLQFFYPRLSTDGIMVVHDYNAWPGVRMAVDDYFLNKKESPIPMPDKSGSALIMKQKDTD
ncbi:MAG: TylF/MycF/NovP-related O-methyltransferase [Syntrophales bacterium]